jgi:hypothetical protein
MRFRSQMPEHPVKMILPDSFKIWCHTIPDWLLENSVDR